MLALKKGMVVLVLTLVALAIYGTYRAGSDCVRAGGVPVRGSMGGTVCVDAKHVIPG